MSKNITLSLEKCWPQVNLGGKCVYNIKGGRSAIICGIKYKYI